MRVSSENDRQVFDLQYDALINAGVDQNRWIQQLLMESLFSVFGALAQYERSLTKERIMAGLTSAKQRGKRGGRPKVISLEKMHAISESLKSGVSKAAICRTFNVKRTTLYDNLDNILNMDS